MPTSTKELERLVIKAQEATRNLDDNLRRIAFERVLDHLLGSCETRQWSRRSVKTCQGERMRLGKSPMGC